jgi:hypothetical protein
MAERRRAPRKAISYYLQVMDATTQEVIGNLVDVSTVGIMIDGRNVLTLDKVIRIRMDTTPDVANLLHIEFTARVKWCHADKFTPGIYESGLELVQISPANAEVLLRIADKYGSKDSSFRF